MASKRSVLKKAVKASGRGGPGEKDAPVFKNLGLPNAFEARERKSPSTYPTGWAKTKNASETADRVRKIGKLKLEASDAKEKAVKANSFSGLVKETVKGLGRRK